MTSNTNPLTCVLLCKASSIALKPRITKTDNGKQEVLIDIIDERGATIADSMLLSEMHKLDEFLTAVYDWRRQFIFPGVKR